MKSQGVGKGDDVTIYMPMIPELPATMVSVACARVGRPDGFVWAALPCCPLIFVWAALPSDLATGHLTQ